MTAPEANAGWDHETDLVVVGAGAAGMTAALTAHARGKQALVLEKSDKFGGTSAMSGGALWVPMNHLMREAGAEDVREDAERYLVAVTKGRTQLSKLRTYLDRAPEMLAFLAKHTHARFVALMKYPDYYPEAAGGRTGGRSVEAEPFDGRRLGNELFRLRAPHPQECVMGRVMMSAAEAHEALFGSKAAQKAVIWRLIFYFLNVWERVRWRRDTRLTIGNALTARLRLSMLEAALPLWYEARVTSLVVEAGRVTGVVVSQGGKALRVRARSGVLLAAGGFAKSPTLRAKWQRKEVGTTYTAASPEDTGDSLSLTEGLSPKLDLMGESWWTPTTVVPGETLPWILVVEKSLPGSIMVNQLGKRFTNEAAPYVDVVNGIFADQDATVGKTVPAYLILDARARRKYPLGPIMPGASVPEWAWKRAWTDGWLVKAPTIAALATRLGIDGATLEATVARWNGFAKTGKDEDFARGESAYDRYYADPRVTPNPAVAPLARGPYYAIPVSPGDLGTKGGLVTDDDARVLTEGDVPIPGLYAAGNSAASMMGLTYPGAGGTIGPAMTFAHLAAEHACRAAD